MNKPKIVLTLIIALAVAGVGIAAFDAAGIPEQFEEKHEVAQAYCYQSYGDAEVYNPNTAMGHGGFHCVGNVMAERGDPHYHEVTTEARRAAVEANRSGRSVDWSRVDRYKDSGPTERYLHQTVAVLPSALGVAGLAVGLGWVQRKRTDNADKTGGER